MKKLLACALFLAMLFSLAACGGSPAPAPAATEVPAQEETSVPVEEAAEEPEPEPEPEPPAPFGIPLWNSVEEVELDVLLAAHSRKNLLQYAENFETIEDIFNDSNYEKGGHMQYKSHAEICYFLDGEQYVQNRTNSSDMSTMNSTMLVIYNVADREQSGNYQKDFMGHTEWPINPEFVDRVVESCILPFNGYTIEDLARYVVDNHYVFTFRLIQEGEREESAYTEFNDCMIEVDPETSLIVRYAYQQHAVRTEEGTTTDASGKTHTIAKGEQTSIVDGEILYNVADKQPDYSLLP